MILSYLLSLNFSSVLLAELYFKEAGRMLQKVGKEKTPWVMSAKKLEMLIK